MSWTHYNNPIFSGNIKTWSPIEDNGLVNHYFVIEHTGSTTGIQTSFSLPSYTKVSDYCAANGLTLREGDPDATTNTARGFSTQGPKVLILNKDTTENDLSGLASLSTGVSHSIDKQGTDLYEVDADTYVTIWGTLNHDPDREILVINLNRPSHATSAHYYISLKLYGTYNYGVETTIGDRTSYSSGNGLFITGDASMGNWNPRDSAFGGGGLLVGRGGVITSNKMFSYGGQLDVKKTNFVGTPGGALLEWRVPFGNASSTFDGFFTGFGIIKPTSFPATLGLKKATIGEVISNSLYEGTLKDFDVSQNIADYDIGHDGMNGRGHAEWFIVNSATGTDIKTMWRDTRGSTGQRGVVLIQKEVSFNIKDAIGSAIENVALHLEDNPSTYAKDKKFLLSKYVANSSYSDRPNARGEVDADGNLVYKYANAISYTGTTDSNGDIATFKVTTGQQIHEYVTNDGDAVAIYGMTFSGGNWRASSSDNSTAKYYDWDTDKFGSFYKVDRRGNDNTNADLFTFKFCSYGHSLSSSTQALKGLGELEVDWVLFDDALITDIRATTDAYSEIDSPQKFYNKAKAYLTDNYAGETSTIVSREGNTINAGSYDVVLDASASSVFAISGNTLTIKATTFVGNISTSGSTTLSNDAKVIGTFGSTTVLPWEIKNIEATSRLQLYNVTKDAEVITQKLTGIAYNKTILLELAGHTYAVALRYGGAFIDATSVEVIASGDASDSWTLQSGAVQFNVGNSGVLGSALIQDDTDIKVDLLQGNESNTVTATATINSSEFNDEAITNSSGSVDVGGTYDSSEIAVGDVVRLRVTCVVGNTAMLPVVVTGVATTAGLNFSIDQQADTIYNTNAVDGSAINAWTADFTNTPMGVDLSESDGGATVQEIYAYIVYQQTTANGVDKWFNVVRAIDGSNYQIDQTIADIKIQNIGTVAVNISGGRIFRKDGASVLYAVDGDKPLSLDTGALVANIQPQIEGALNSNPTISSINKNSKLIAALL